MDVFSVELAVEFLVNVPAGVVLGAEQVCPGQRLFLTLALLLQHVRADEFGIWEGFVPVVHEDVVLGVVGGNILDSAHLVDLAANIVGESDRGEDGYAAILQTDWKVSVGAARDGCEQEHTERSATTNVDLAEACKGERERDDIWSDVANDHDLVGV